MLKSNGWGTGIEEELVVLDYGDSGGMGREYVSLWDNSGQIAPVGGQEPESSLI